MARGVSLWSYDPLREKLKTEYIEGKSSIHALGEKYGLPHATVWRWFRTGKWDDLRQELVNRRIKFREEDIEVRGKVLKGALNLVAKTIIAWQDKGPMPPKDLKCLTSAICDLERSRAMLRGDPDLQHVKITIDLARLINQRAKEVEIESLRLKIIDRPNEKANDVAFTATPVPPSNNGNGNGNPLVKALEVIESEGQKS